MSQFEQIVKNIALESKKCNYNPKKGPNWHKLNWKMQNECLKHMDFKTRIRLSETSRSEKSTFDEEFRNFGCIVKTIALESKKCNYNPEIDTNWCNLPMEMRNECLKRMDFQERCRFRRVSKTEKSLIESRKHHLEFLRLYYEKQDQCWLIETDSSEDYTYKPAENTCIPAVFKLNRFDLLCFKGTCNCGECVKPMLDEILKFAPFQFKRLAVFDNPSIAQIMRHCVNLEKVDFRGDFPEYLLIQILRVPIFLNVKELRFSRANTAQFGRFFNTLVQKWINRDVKVGKSIQFELEVRRVINYVAEEFASRIIEKTDEIVRIRMYNEKTQILLRLIGSRVVTVRHCFSPTERHGFEYCSCKVIPIDMPESEYATGDGWIQAVYEKRLKEDGKLENPVEFDAEDQKVWGKL